VSIIENLKFLDNTSIFNKSKLLDLKDNDNNNKENIYTSLTDYNLLSDDYLEFLNNLTTSNNSNFNVYYFYSSIDNYTSIDRNIKFSRKKKRKF
jgi:predicted S18 family serine protease